jgi:hypothetical protein
LHQALYIVLEFVENGSLRDVIHKYDDDDDDDELHPVPGDSSLINQPIANLLNNPNNRTTTIAIATVVVLLLLLLLQSHCQCLVW